MSPPGGNTAPQDVGQHVKPTESQLIDFSITVLRNINRPLSVTRIRRTIHAYYRVFPKANGWNFIEYLCDQLKMDHDERAAARSDWAKVIDHADPTGETAVRNVVRLRGF